MVLHIRETSLGTDHAQSIGTCMQSIISSCDVCHLSAKSDKSDWSSLRSSCNRTADAAPIIEQVRVLRALPPVPVRFVKWSWSR